MGCLQRCQNRSYSINHVLQLNALLLNIIFYVLQIFDQRLQQTFLLLQKLPLALYLLLLLLRQIQRIFQLQKPLIFITLLLISEEVFALRGRPHHVSVQGRQRQVDNLPEILVNGVDSLSSGGSYSGPQRIDDGVDLLRGVLALARPLEQVFYLFHHLVAAGRES